MFLNSNIFQIFYVEEKENNKKNTCSLYCFCFIFIKFLSYVLLYPLKFSLFRPMKTLPPCNLEKSAFIEVVEVNNEAGYIHGTKIPVLCIIDSNTHAHARSHGQSFDINAESSLELLPQILSRKEERKDNASGTQRAHCFLPLLCIVKRIGRSAMTIY